MDCAPARRNERGFTTMELIVVMIILALSAGILLPRIGTGVGRLEDRDFVLDFVQTLKRARLRAANSGQVVAFRIRSPERLYGLEDPPSRAIPENVDIYADNLEKDPDTQDLLIIFFPDGSLVGNDLELVFDQRRAYRIAIHPILGTVRWLEVEPR